MKRKTIVGSTLLPKIKNSNNKINVALVYGGMSSEREVSLMSFQGFKSNLLELGYKVTPIDMGYDISEHIINVKPDIVFNGLYGTYGEDGSLSGLLDILGIKYTHSGTLASALAFNKEISFKIFESTGIKVADYRVVSKNDKIKSDPMPRPYVIKPISEGSSVGVEIVFEGDSFDFSKYKWAHGNRVIVQKYIKGREIQVSIFKDKAIGALEIKPLKRRFYDYDTKYTDGMADHIMPAKLESHIEEKMFEISEKAHHCLKCNNINRVEFIFDECEGIDGIYILEANTNPGMTPLSIVPETCAYYGISYKDILNELVQNGLKT
ncbi:MAG: D-alanine--D-alanine ligase [Alphaproteobacteria bacterium]|nr:D-alanine--D-alanine ligase [Alphaproteobacteria bacterium]